LHSATAKETPMCWRRAAVRNIVAAGVALLIGIGTAAAAPPGEVTGVLVGSSSQLSWSPVAGANDYNVYRGRLSWLARGDGAECYGDEIAATTFTSAADPPVGDGFFYLVTAESNLDGEGSAGTGSSGLARPLRGRCDVIIQHHVFDRLGYGSDEWSRARMAALGLQGYIDEQLNPASIDESTNNELINRRAALVPPETMTEFYALDVVNAVYTRRQLEQQVTMFWDNHFNTDHQESFDFFIFYSGLYSALQALE